MDGNTRTGFDVQMEALAHVRRRRVLVELFRGDTNGEALGGGQKLGTVVRMAQKEDGEADRRHVDLRHNHLPKLEDLGFVSWDRQNHRVTEGPQFSEIEPLLELLDENENGLVDGWV